MIMKNVNVNKLHNEFIENGIRPFPVLELENGEGDFTFESDTDMNLVQQIIDAHEPTPLPTPLTENELLKISQAEQFETILELLGGMM